MTKPRDVPWMNQFPGDDRLAAEIAAETQACVSWWSGFHDEYAALSGRGKRPSPHPGLLVDPADRALAPQANRWVSEHHFGSNTAMAHTLETWLTAKGLKD